MCLSRADMKTPPRARSALQSRKEQDLFPLPHSVVQICRQAGNPPAVPHLNIMCQITLNIYVVVQLMLPSVFQNLVTKNEH